MLVLVMTSLLLLGLGALAALCDHFAASDPCYAEVTPSRPRHSAPWREAA